MATVPVYIIAGDFAGVEGGGSSTNVAATATDPPVQTSIISAWNFQFASNNRRYDFPNRIQGVGGVNKRFPADPLGFSYAPRAWVQGPGAANRKSISTITTGAVTTLTLSSAHNRVAGKTAEVLVQSVSGTDAASLNRTWQGTFRSTNQIEIPLNSTGMTFTSPSGNVEIPLWYFFSDTLASPVFRTQDADPTNGGSLALTTDATGRWGYEVGLLADIHDYHGARGETAHVIAHAIAAPINGRPELTISAATNATECQITVTSHQGPQDAGKPFPVIITGLTGLWSGLNGLQQAVYVSGNALRIVGANSTAWGSYPGGGKIRVMQRAHKRYTGEVYDDLIGRVGDAISAIEDQGDDPYIAGIFASYGRRDAQFAQGTVPRLTGIEVSAITTGFPTVLTLSSATNITAPASGKANLVVDIAGAGETLSGRHECLIVSTTQIQVLVETSGTISADGVTLQLSEPGQFFTQDLREFVDDLRADAAALCDQTAASIPIAFGPPRYVEATTWDGVQPLTSTTGSGLISRAVGLLDRRTDGIGNYRTNDLDLQLGSSVKLSQGALVEAGRRSWNLMRRLQVGISTKGRGVPCYVLIGDSQAGSVNTWIPAATSGNTDYNGLHGTVRGIKNFNHTTKQNVEYTAVTGGAAPGNGNTHPIFGGAEFVGPEASLYLERKIAHPDQDVFWMKLAVSGSAITDVTDPSSVVTVEEEIDESENRFAVLTLASSSQHFRFDQAATFTVQLRGLSSAGLADGAYAATAPDPLTVRIPIETPLTGSYSGNGTVDVPRWDWRKSKSDIWPYLETAQAEWFTAIEAEGAYPDVRGIFIYEGTNDALFASDVSGWEANAKQLIADLRALFQTRSTPDPALPVVWQRLRSHPNYPGGAATQTKVAAIQAAQASIEATDSAVKFFNPDSSNDGDREINRVPVAGDNVHFTWQGVLESGLIAENAFQQVDQSCGAGPGAGPSFSSVS